MTRIRTQGFTLIEAAVAIAVVAILSGIIAPLVVKNLNDARVARARNDVQVIAGAIASQLKDTGSRPRLAGGPNASTGVGQALWHSLGAGWVGGGSGPAAAATSAQRFESLFCFPGTDLTANTLFNTTVGAEFSYRGPYLANDVAQKTDPWGNRYVILGYNVGSQGVNGPIWIVCAGPDGSVLAANRTVTANAYPTTWTTTGVSLDDIVVRVN